jgi:hypothetical protein
MLDVVARLSIVLQIFEHGLEGEQHQRQLVVVVLQAGVVAEPILPEHAHLHESVGFVEEFLELPLG